jgi:hypothetical protein
MQFWKLVGQEVALCLVPMSLLIGGFWVFGELMRFAGGV